MTDFTPSGNALWNTYPDVYRFFEGLRLVTIWWSFLTPTAHQAFEA